MLFLRRIFSARKSDAAAAAAHLQPIVKARVELSDQPVADGAPADDHGTMGEIRELDRESSSSTPAPEDLRWRTNPSHRYAVHLLSSNMHLCAADLAEEVDQSHPRCGIFPPFPSIRTSCVLEADDAPPTTMDRLAQSPIELRPGSAGREPHQAVAASVTVGFPSSPSVPSPSLEQDAPDDSSTRKPMSTARTTAVAPLDVPTLGDEEEGAEEQAEDGNKDAPGVAVPSRSTSSTAAIRVARPRRPLAPTPTPTVRPMPPHDQLSTMPKEDLIDLLVSYRRILEREEAQTKKTTHPRPQTHLQHLLLPGQASTRDTDPESHQSSADRASIEVDSLAPATSSPRGTLHHDMT